MLQKCLRNVMRNGKQHHRVSQLWLVYRWAYKSASASKFSTPYNTEA